MAPRAKARPKGKTSDRSPTRKRATGDDYATSFRGCDKGTVYLHVAEKPSVAREVLKHLNTTGQRVSYLKSWGTYNPVAKFTTQFEGREAIFMVTSVLGHLLEMKFDEPFGSLPWSRANPELCFSSRVSKVVGENMGGIAKTLATAAKYAKTLVLWLDCDREGENIGFEVINICTASNQSILARRAIFSACSRVDIQRAVASLQQPNQLVSAAVDVRQEFDFRVGISITRWLTLKLKNALNVDHVISFGPCQAPTLRIIVDQYARFKDHIPEAFWVIDFRDSFGNCYTWHRNRIFDRISANAIFGIVEAHRNNAKVVRLDESRKTRWRPLPLSTVEFTKLASRKLRITSERAMQLAEGLYQKGYVSYPRTETEIYPASLDLLRLVENFDGHESYGDISTSLKASFNSGGQPGPPLNIRAANARRGQRDDEAHPPIHPVRALNRGSADEETWNVYDLIARHFLASVTADAMGAETVMGVSIGSELFTTKGLVIHEKNFLEIYGRFQGWSERTLHRLDIGEIVTVAYLELRESETTPPAPLDEAELITVMDKHGIGTDATMHDHIKTIQARQYAKHQSGFVPAEIVQDGETADDAPVDRTLKRFIPTPLGLGLIDAYKSLDEAMEGGDCSAITLRASLERDIAKVATGERSSQDVLINHLTKYKQIYDTLSRSGERVLHMVSEQIALHGGVT